MFDHFLMIMIMSVISVFMIMLTSAFPLRRKRHNGPYDIIITSPVGTKPKLTMGLLLRYSAYTHKRLFN